MNESREREISIGELFLHAFKHWKVMILAAIVGGLLLGGYSYSKSVKNYNAAVNAQKNDDDAKKELTASEKEYVDTIVKQYEDAVQAQKDYADTYLGKMDAKNVYEKDINLYVKLLDEYDPEVQPLVLSDLMEAYKIFLNSQEFRTGVTKEVDSISLNEVPYLVSAGYTNRILSIKIKTSSKADAKTIRSYIDSKLTEYTEVVADKIANHSIEIYNEKEYEINDTAISDAQKAYRDSITAQKDAVKATFASMSYEQVMLFEEQVEMKLPDLFNQPYDKLGVTVPKTANTTVTIPAKGIDKKKTVIGIILGVFVVFGCVWCSVLFSKKLKISDDAKLSKDMEIYGPIASKDNVSNIAKKIYGINQNTVDDQIEYVAKRISMDAKGADVKNITVISSCMSVDEIKSYTSKMSMDGVTVNVVDGNLRSTVTLKELENADTVVFAEKFNSTVRAEYEYEVALAMKNGKKVLGTMMMV